MASEQYGEGHDFNEHEGYFVYIIEPKHNQGSISTDSSVIGIKCGWLICNIHINDYSQSLVIASMSMDCLLR